MDSGVTNSDRKDTDVPRKKKKPKHPVKRYWLDNEGKTDANIDNKAKQDEEKPENKVEEIVIDPETLLKYTRGNQVNTKV